MIAIWYLGSEIYSFNLLQNVHDMYPQVIIENLFSNNREKIVDSNVKLRKLPGLSLLLNFSQFISIICTRLHFNDNWECFLFWNQNFCLQIKNQQEKLTVVTENESTVCYFNKMRFGMNNQLTLPRTERLFYFKITSS